MDKNISFSLIREKNKISISIHGDYSKDIVKRSEGNLDIKINNTTVNFISDYLYNVNGDKIALVAILSFWPLITNCSDNIINISFDWNVSHKFKSLIENFRLLKHLNIKSNLEYVEEDNADRIVLSYGGGFDSLAASIIFPNAVPIHESPIAVLENRITDSVIDISNKVKEDLNKKIEFVYTDQRYLYTTFGLPVWTAMYSSSILSGAKRIYSGTVMDATYLLDGIAYRTLTDKPWYDLFKNIGVEVLPTSFLSEISNTRIIMKNNLSKYTCYCVRIPFQDCGGCIKCLRKRLLKFLYGEPFGDFNFTEKIIKELKKRPLKLGNVYAHVYQKTGWLPEPVLDAFSDIKDQLLSRDYSFQEKIKVDFFDDMGYDINEKNRIINLLNSMGISIMDKSSELNMQKFIPIG
ncbi:MAG: DUF6395 domain-containing protein [Methanothrix sp.]|jgi:hypothetical protein|nr:DUF6395 domain-containing protein [Methanothrix sp.]